MNLEEFIKRHNPHPETVAYLQKRAADNAKPYYEIGVTEARKASEAVAAKYSEPVEFDGSETELFVPSPQVKDGIPITVYKPSACDHQLSPVILVYFHGGGNVVGSRKTHESICKIISRDAACIVVNVEYRLAPEHKFPANIDDGNCVVEWTAQNKTIVGGSTKSKLGVSGDSAGARIAAVACHEVKGHIDFAILVYPNAGSTVNHPSVQEFKDGPLLSRPAIEWFHAAYFSTDKEKTSPRASVINSPDFSGHPPTLLIVAELDQLRDGCIEFYEKLKSSSVKTDLKLVKGVPHAFWNITGAFKETGKEAQTAAIKFISQFQD